MSTPADPAGDDLVIVPPPPPADAPAPPAETLTPIVLPAGAPTRSPVLLLAVAIAAAAGFIVNLAGLVGFPHNAPVEQIYALGISVDLLAIVVVCGLGALMSRRGYPLRAETPLTVVALAFAVGAALLWMVAGGIASVIQLFTAEGGRYMYASAGLFFGGAIWVLAVVFGAHGYRRGGTPRNNALAIAALALAGGLAGYAIFSSLTYGLGFTN
ncbi:hypothetical protein [Pseudolysinimonas yzui]|uniref:Uncharacterized protein n=1 Tax=Pseudolysinimonas yzui TaxID=2708254 RepID=A0A8J3GST6_9MICO|nr:hypothetical protein [Pseudolysinimonas yzui]GHF24135.1 hypothetical protein GCM10011600_26440 [Pseudolysinimonas yzui]